MFTNFAKSLCGATLLTDSGEAGGVQGSIHKEDGLFECARPLDE